MNSRLKPIWMILLAVILYVPARAASWQEIPPAGFDAPLSGWSVRFGGWVHALSPAPPPRLAEERERQRAITDLTLRSIVAHVLMETATSYAFEQWRLMLRCRSEHCQGTAAPAAGPGHNGGCWSLRHAWPGRQTDAAADGEPGPPLSSLAR